MDSGDNGDTRLLNSPKQLLSFLTETGDLLTSCTRLKHTESKEKKKNQDKLLTFQLSILNLIHLLTFFVKYVLVYLHFYTYKTNKQKATQNTPHTSETVKALKSLLAICSSKETAGFAWNEDNTFWRSIKPDVSQHVSQLMQLQRLFVHLHTQNYVISRVKHVVRTVTNLISL